MGPYRLVLYSIFILSCRFETTKTYSNTNSRLFKLGTFSSVIWNLIPQKVISRYGPDIGPDFLKIKSGPESLSGPDFPCPARIFGPVRATMMMKISKFSFR